MRFVAVGRLNIAGAALLGWSPTRSTQYTRRVGPLCLADATHGNVRTHARFASHGGVTARLCVSKNASQCAKLNAETAIRLLHQKLLCGNGLFSSPYFFSRHERQTIRSRLMVSVSRRHLKVRTLHEFLASTKQQKLKYMNN